MDEGRTAIVTGAGKRIGEALAHRLSGQGWTVIANVRPGSSAPAGARAAPADLGTPDCAERIFAACDGLPPVRLLINNGARFAWDTLGEFSAAEFDAHMHVNVRAPLLLTEALAARHGDGDALVVNILDAKLQAPNPDFLSYTVSKQALAGATELAARALAGKGIRVNAIAPALMLRSNGQSEQNYRAMHAANPLGRGVVVDDIFAALDYLLAARSVTGEVLTIDGGQRFAPPQRDVQFLEA
ncbi:SDR family oxidoreductase [Sphingomonas sabuli]|uniref:SDR family oxidoreductase n=1 Tax=Sphingomonas sabuli TaxID=2764186 RepID=A0A7G9L4W3_9SPHN|nr:SDR family oxidoreductase [Sphingomonas sabuli]QNM83662.1 SDR family oxidoreductase [Sphingomonas sabuli]